MKTYFLFIASLVLLSGLSCKGNVSLPAQNQNSIFIYHYSVKETNVINDIKNTLDKNYQRICDDLEYQYNYKIQVYIYPDQKTYDDNLSDKDIAGSPACSGGRRMQFVSPNSLIKIPGIPYNERLQMPVHEFVHLMVDEINNNLPIWIDEGLAAKEGSSDIYEYFCRLSFPELSLIKLQYLEEKYFSIPGADIYSYTAVRFIIQKFGLKKFNIFLRNPGNFEKIFSMTKDQFSKEWNLFITKNYGKK
jgi:hypothetical protein